MDNKIRIDLNNIEKTLLMPLWGRVKETDRKDPLIVDTYAKEIIKKIDYDFSNMESNFSEIESFTWVIRAYHFDNTIENFISNHENSLIINIGAGLDTTFSRIDDGKVGWVNLDLPGVIALRKKLMPNSEREISIGKSAFDFSWIEDIGETAKGKAVMLFAAGVFFYFEENQLKELFRKIADVYPEAHLVFDSFPWLVAWSWNRELKKGNKGKIDPSAPPMKWYLNKASRLRNWTKGLKVVDEYPLCARIEFKEDWSKQKIFEMKVMNFLRLYNMVHVQF